jgi:RND family efflux transporter MFP subunit
MRIAYLALPLFALASLGAFVARTSTPKTVAKRPPATAGPTTIRAEGRVVTYPDGEVTVGSELTARVLTVAVHEKDIVKKGDVLVILDGEETRAALAEARARIAESDAEVTAADADVARMEQLAASHAISRQELDHARRDRDAAAARRTATAATASRLEASLAKTRIVAPIGGVITERLVEPGQIVQADTKLATVADLRRTRIEAEVDEYDAGRVALGAPVAVSAEGFGTRVWNATVEEIPDAVVGRRLKPQDPGRPSDTRVLLVKVALTGPTPLRLGQRVEVAINQSPLRD